MIYELRSPWDLMSPVHITVLFMIFSDWLEPVLYPSLEEVLSVGWSTVIATAPIVGIF